MPPRLLLTAVPTLLLAGCGSVPYEDADLSAALRDVDHVSSSTAGCADVDLSWRCRPTVVLEEAATARDVAAAIRATMSVLREGKDTARVEVQREDAGERTPSAATVELSVKPARTSALAEGMVAAVRSDHVEHSTFGARADTLAVSATFVDGTPAAVVARQARDLLETSSATSVTALGRALRLTARGGAWPADELAVLGAVRDDVPVVRATVRRDFLSILVGPGTDLDRARATAERQPGFAAIATVDVTDDPESDISNADDAETGRARQVAEVLRPLPGYRRMSVSNGYLRVEVDTLAHARAMDAALHSSSRAAYDALETTYLVEGVATVTRPSGADPWFDLAGSLVDSGLFDSVQVGRPEPSGRTRAVDVVAKDGVPPAEAAGAVASAWRPGQDASVRLSWIADRRAFTTFAAGETITVEPRARVSARVAEAIETGWARARAS